MNTDSASMHDYDSVELRVGRLHKIRRAEARVLGDEDRTVWVVKCYCRNHDVLTPADAELQQRPTFVFPTQFFENLEGLIGRDLEGRIYRDSQQHRVKFYLDLKEHAGFQLDEAQADLRSPWYDDSALKE